MILVLPALLWRCGCSNKIVPDIIKQAKNASSYYYRNIFITLRVTWFSLLVYWFSELNKFLYALDEALKRQLGFGI